MSKKKAKPKKKTPSKGKARFVSFTSAPNRPSPAQNKALAAKHKNHRKRLTKFLQEAKLVLSDERYEQAALAATELSDSDNALYHRLYTALHNRPWSEPD